VGLLVDLTEKTLFGWGHLLAGSLPSPPPPPPTFRLNNADLDGVSYHKVVNPIDPRYHPMKIYSMWDLQVVARKKWGHEAAMQDAAARAAVKAAKAAATRAAKLAAQ
jgi:hypothetical protein